MSNSTHSETKQYLTFKLSGEIFAVEVAKVREILDFIKITKIPQTPEYMCGIINLRGSVVPVIDMNLKFGMPKGERTVATSIIVVEFCLDTGTLILGALVDAVLEVFEIEHQNIEPPPKFGAKFNAEVIKGIGKHDEQFIIILDIDKVLALDELTMVQGSRSFSNERMNENLKEN